MKVFARMFLVYMAELKDSEKSKSRLNLLEMFTCHMWQDKKIGGFPGMKQRVLLAQALLGNPKLLILDEPTAGLDPEEHVNLRNYVHQLSQNKIILLATRGSDVESIADRILIMKAGELVADDTPEHLVHAVDGNNLEMCI
ncbi:MAG: ATP-binding cassette domain-containing protein [Clostridium sp.]